jgi:sulfide dehydrogenase cytochrome subunit
LIKNFFADEAIVKFFILLLSFLSLLVLPVQAEVANAPQTIMLAQTCAGCHGTQGEIRDSAFVPLAGLPESRFIQAMQAFKDGSRPSTLMGALARAFSDQEIAAMAAYFAQFPTPAP